MNRTDSRKGSPPSRSMNSSMTKSHSSDTLPRIPSPMGSEASTPSGVELLVLAADEEVSPTSKGMGLGSFDPARARADDLCGSNTEHGKRKVQPFRRSNDSFQESLHRSPLQISRRASEEAMPSLVPVVGKLGSVELVNTQCNVLPWSPVKIKWKILDENPKDAFLALYPAGEHDLEHYESSILCRGHVAATSVMISPHIPGFYTLRLVRAPSETLGLTTFRVVAPIEGASGNRPGQWLADPEEFSDEVENYVNNDLRELIRGRIRFSDDDPLNATGPISEQSSSEVVESPAPALAKITRRRAAAPPPTQESQR